MLTFSSEFDILYKQPQEVVAKMISSSSMNSMGSIFSSI